MPFDPAALIYLASEGIKLLLQHLSQSGQLNNLTQADAEAMVQKLAAGLPALLPTPEELEQPPAPPITQ